MLNVQSEHAALSFVTKLQNDIIRDPSSFWSFVKRNRRSNQPATFGDMAPDEVANAFANFFESVFLQNTPTLDVAAACAAANIERVPSSNRLITIDLISDEDIRSAINRLRPKHTQGPDGIPQFIVKDCREAFILPLKYIFNLSLLNKTYPSAWKTSKVLPIHKSGPQV